MKKEKFGYVTTLVLITLIILKLTNTINWSWWAVFSPLWVPILLLIVLLCIKNIIYNQ